MHLFLDLDGTLTDSFPGISRCINETLEQLGHERIADAQIRTRIGRPLGIVFGELLATRDPALVDRAVALYRDCFDETGIRANRLYPGIREALETFASWGHSLTVVTVKPTHAAIRALSHLGIQDFFLSVQGSNPQEHSSTKTDLLRLAMKGVDPMRAAMIGDHVDDVHAAKRNGAKAVAAGWGYGHPDDLAGAAPDYFAPSVPDLINWIRSAA